MTGINTMLFGSGLRVKSRQFVSCSITANTAIAHLKADRAFTLAAPVANYLNCIVIMHGWAPFLTTVTYAGITYTAQLNHAKFYGHLTANDTLVVSTSLPTPDDGNVGVTGVSQALVTNWYGAVVVAEIIELEGHKSITYGVYEATQAQVSSLTIAEPAGIVEAKSYAILQGGILACTANFNLIEYFEFAPSLSGGNVIGTLMETHYLRNGSNGQSPIKQNTKIGYYVIETA